MLPGGSELKITKQLCSGRWGLYLTSKIMEICEYRSWELSCLYVGGYQYLGLEQRKEVPRCSQINPPE